MDATPLASTRRALHAVAELVLAGPQHRSTGELALAVTPGGFGTTAGPALAVDGTELVIGAKRVPIDGASCADLAAAAGVEVGAPRDLYHDGTNADPDEPLRLDADHARWLARCWAAGDAAMRRLSTETPILWPEHFDVGITVDAVNYGVSPGDGYLDEPYAYVGPHTPRTGEFWNAPFGAARPMRELGEADPDAVLAFFAQGKDA